jgi:hypothetical protein
MLQRHVQHAQSRASPCTRSLLHTARLQAHYIDDPEPTFVMQRTHNFYQSLCGLPVLIKYKPALKVSEFANLGLPSTALSAVTVIHPNAAKYAHFFSECLLCLPPNVLQPPLVPCCRT